GIRAHEDTIQFAAADKVLTIYSSCYGKVTCQGEAYLPPKLLVDIIKELPPGKVELSSEQGWLKITAGTHRQCEMKLPFVDEQSWPQKPARDHFAALPPLDAATLSYLVEQVMICVNHESSVRYSTVAFIHSPAPGLLRMVGTDGFRLSYAETALDVSDSSITQGLCLSKRSLLEILRVCAEGFETIALGVSTDGHTIRMEVQGCEVYIRVSTVSFPSYQTAIPEAQPNKVTLPKAELQSMVKRVLLTSNRHRTVMLQFAPQELQISATNAGNSEGKETLALAEQQLESTQVSFKGKYLLDICSVSVNSHELSMEYLNGSAPVILRPCNGPNNSSAIHVLVPMHEQGQSKE
ncbi:MAG: DNA polymerase III subunit beta, partial [Zetaproteobacteria bacterium]|nr:DNA polymerase III subunit beta [Zetaproteobacteria bacterium]